MFGPPTKSEVSFKMQLYEKEDEKASLLLVSKIRCSYKSLMTGKDRINNSSTEKKSFSEKFFSY